MFGDVVGVVLRRILDEFLAIRIDHAHLAIVEIDLVIVIHHAHVIGVVGVDIAQDQVKIGFVAQDNIIESLQAELGKFDRPAAHLLRFPCAVLR